MIKPFPIVARFRTAKFHPTTILRDRAAALLPMIAIVIISTICAGAATRYVSQNNLAPAWPYTNWNTAATNIQIALDVAEAGDLILVSNGVYAVGGRKAEFNGISNRVALMKPVVLQSVNGPRVTTIVGHQVAGEAVSLPVVRCAYLTNGAVLSGFTLTNGGTDNSYNGKAGGGVYCESVSAVVSNCVLVANSASVGGAIYSGTIYNSLLTMNSAQMGGGAAVATLNNCSIVGNFALSQGGGVYGGHLTNCILYFNTAASDGNFGVGTTLDYCCTVPLPLTGEGNISNDPQLASIPSLSVGSPCRGAGTALAARGIDIDGEPWANSPSIGCDESWSGTLTGSVTCAISMRSSNVAVGFSLDFHAIVDGPVTGSSWDFGDGTLLNNRPIVSHSWKEAGDYEVVLRAYNHTHPEGTSAKMTVHVSQPVYHVASNSRAPEWPYDSWATAASNIQDAVDAAIPGSVIVVSNGTYGVGGRFAAGGSNRVAVIKPVVLRSVNGPSVTTVVGVPAATTTASEALRCVYLTNGAVLEGFTLTNGVSEKGGGVRCESASAIVLNCVLAGCSASYGGGVYSGTLSSCEIVGNSAWNGGGAYSAVLNNCAVSGNLAESGGGAASSTLNSCSITGNSASFDGGGAYGSSLNACMITCNSSQVYGGGAAYGVLKNCNVIGNSATWFGGGVYDSRVNNCVLYYNTANDGNFSTDSVLNHCCTVPLPKNGIGNIDAEPQLASASHLSITSPCRGAGSAAVTSAQDIDGEPWADSPSIGCDEPRDSAVTGDLSVRIGVAYTNVAVGSKLDFDAIIGGRPSGSRWDFGDGTVLTNHPITSHEWKVQGKYEVRLIAYNETDPGVIASTNIYVGQPIHYVALDSLAPESPYNSWATAATDIQDAVDVAIPGGLILVSNGVYAVGGRTLYGMSNRVAVTKPMTLRSVNGPAVTSIVGCQLPDRKLGQGAARCAYLTDGVVLDGFTLTGGATVNGGSDQFHQFFGGAVWCESTNSIITNCVIVGNAAVNAGGGCYLGTLNNCVILTNSAGGGGGTHYSQANNCLFAGNSANFGGASSYGRLNNCTVVGNSALYRAGGCDRSFLKNCIVYFNGPLDGNYSLDEGGMLDHCCTTPLPPTGEGNFTLPPQFVDQALGDFRLQPHSPCINAGLNSYSKGAADLIGSSRIANNTVDVGAYEYQGPGSSISHAWLQQHLLPEDESVDSADPDRDLVSNWQEWVAGTHPTNSASALRMLSVSISAGAFFVTWTSVKNRTYVLERSTLMAPLPDFAIVQTNIAGLSPTTSFLDTNAIGSGPFFYRVRVNLVSGL